LHDVNGFVFDRLQTAGASNLNQNTEVIRELGNWQNVATVRDTVNLSFDMESFDVSSEIEAVVTGADPDAVVAGQEFDFNDSKPVDIVAPLKSARNQYDIAGGVITPYLTLENVTYRFGVGQNSTQSYTLRGDTINYVRNGTPRYQEFTVTAGTSQTYNFANTAMLYDEAGDTIYAISVCAKEVGTNNYRRLFFGDDYTNTSSGFTVLDDIDAEGYDRLHVTYATASATTYPQVGNNPTGNTVHQGVSVKPAAIRGKDIDLYVGSSAATPVFARWGGVQSVEVTRRVNLETDEELGNYHYVAQDYDTADVTGTITLRPASVDALFEKIYEILNVPDGEVAGPYTTVGLPLEIRINDPDAGSTIKTLYVPDARFSAPALQGRVGQRQEISLAWTSDTGVLLVYNEDRP
jgi:hypothetical protein